MTCTKDAYKATTGEKRESIVKRQLALGKLQASG